jgi:hypothetical protein
MRDFRQRNNISLVPHPPSTIPAQDERALERRHVLDEQQRAYRGGGASPQWVRPRPPG